jgi:hypothetical protein
MLALFFYAGYPDAKYLLLLVHNGWQPDNVDRYSVLLYRGPWWAIWLYGTGSSSAGACARHLNTLREVMAQFADLPTI